MLKREGINPDAANEAVSTPDRKSPAPPTPEQAPGSQGQAQPRTGRSRTDLAPLDEVSRQDSGPAKRAALDVIAAAIAELAEERFSGYRPENPPAAGRDGRAAISHDRLIQPLAATLTLVSVGSLAGWIRSRRGQHAGRARRIVQAPVSVG